MQRVLITIAAILPLVGCNVQNVDVAQPVAVGDKFYSALKSGDGETALAQFAPEFRTKANNWPQLLGGLQEKYGPVTSAELQRSSLAAYEGGPCYSLTYAVNRGSLASNEILFLCSKGGNSGWFIRGQHFTRLDTQQSISGGILFNEVGIHVP
jgi:hypothetical protein